MTAHNSIDILPGLQRDVPLAPFTTYKIGGPADYLVTATNADDLAAAVTAARQADVPYFILGEGANILVSDKGFRGLVIRNQAVAAHIHGNELTAESGARVEDLIELAARHGLSGLEHFAGIPGTVGGGVWQNLHFLSPDRSRTVFIAEILKEAEILDGDSVVRTVPVEFFKFGYDESVLRQQPDIIALSATFALQPLPEEQIRAVIQSNRAWRAERHPNLEAFPSCGSVFKKIEGVGAGRLIEQVGLRGFQLGGAQVSEKHANFIVNRGGATAADVFALIKLIQETVEKETGYRLEPEINVVGER